jgi:hypothetical protein
MPVSLDMLHETHRALELCDGGDSETWGADFSDSGQISQVTADGSPKQACASLFRPNRKDTVSTSSVLVTNDKIPRSNLPGNTGCRQPLPAG